MMWCSKISAVAVITLAVAISSCLAESLTYDERCQIVEGNGVRVDQCDSKKFLSCRDGRCQCPDPANQIYTSRTDAISNRNKRSPGKKGGSGKKIAAGFVAGAATYGIANAAVNGAKNGFTTTQRPKYQKVYSCYSRVGGQCALNYNNYEIVDSGATTTTTSTTSAAPDNSTTTTTGAPANSTEVTTTTSTTAAPQAAAQVKTLDITKIPRCVQHARCMTGGGSSKNNGTSASTDFMKKVDFDPRVGVCECEPGYVKTSKDLCVSGTGKTVAGASFAVILAALLVNKMFV